MWIYITAGLVGLIAIVVIIAIKARKRGGRGGADLEFDDSEFPTVTNPLYGKDTLTSEVLNVQGLLADEGASPVYQLGEDVRAILAGHDYERACVSDDPVYERASVSSGPNPVYDTASMSSGTHIYETASLSSGAAGNPIYDTASLSSAQDPVYEIANGASGAADDSTYDNPAPEPSNADYELASFAQVPEGHYDNFNSIPIDEVYDNTEFSGK